MKTFIVATLIIVICLYILVCGVLYFFQERVIFLPEKLAHDHTFQFDQEFEERNIKTADGIMLSGLFFKASASKGLIFYLHGNGGSLNSWGGVAKTYTDLGYDVFLLDYRGYGKSEGVIDGQDQLYSDVQTAYGEMKKEYTEDKIIVLGYSIGTGPASKIASTNKPKLLILQAPYYNLTDMMRQTLPVIPTFILKYTFENNRHLKECEMPVVLFHGDRDEVIYYGSSLKLKEEFKETDTLITLSGQGHNQMTNNDQYRSEIGKLLATEQDFNCQ